MILPGQARDKHGETTLKKEWRFSQVEHDDDFCYTCTEVEVVSIYKRLCAAASTAHYSAILHRRR
jgi:hypothetical protein